jgi:mycothiol synthase
MTAFPDNFTLRPATKDDAQAIAGGVAVEELAETGESETIVDDILELWADWETDLANDARVLVTLDGSIIGYVGISPGDNGFMLDPHMHIRPQYRGQRLEQRLLHFAEQRARERLQSDPTISHVIWSYSFTPARTELLKGAGYTVVSSDYRMQVILHEAPPEPQQLARIIVRRYIPGRDERAIYNVVQEAFPDFTGSPYRPFEEWQEGVLGRQSFDPALLYVALDGNTIVGIVICRAYPEVHQGFINQVAVLRSHRKRGIALHLLLTAFGECYRRGMTDIMLDVDTHNTTGAHQLYERAGMHKIMLVEKMEKALQGSG